MSQEVLLPELAESVVEGEIVQWLINEGDSVKADDPLVEVMTDKVTVELPSPFAGVLEKQLAKEGDILPVGATLALISNGPSPQKAAKAPNPETTTPVTDSDDRSLFKADNDTGSEPLLQVRKTSPETPVTQTFATQRKVTGPFGRVLAVPAARRLARERGIDINTVKGSGPNGRVRLDDVKQHLPGKDLTSYHSPAEYAALETRTPLRGLRRTISSQMVASHLQTVRTLHVDEADVSGLVTLREKLKPLAAKRNAKLSYLPIIMKAVVTALKAYPSLNSSLDEAASELVQKNYYNFGMAVATDLGLVVPVIKNVDQKNILELAAETNRLASKARESKLSPADVQHGTFSISNIGSLGGLFSFPIIKVPEAAILGVHSIKKRPVVLDDDTIAARHMIYLSLSFDHRIVDGAEAAMFTRYLIELLETPESLMLDA